MAAYKYIKKRITWDGKRYEVRGKTEAEALEKLAELLDALKDGRPVTSGDTYVNDWFQEWKRVYKIPSDLTRKSLKLYDEKYTSTSVRWLAKCAFGMYGIFNCNPF